MNISFHFLYVVMRTTFKFLNMPPYLAWHQPFSYQQNLRNFPQGVMKFLPVVSKWNLWWRWICMGPFWTYYSRFSSFGLLRKKCNDSILCVGMFILFWLLLSVRKDGYLSCFQVTSDASHDMYHPLEIDISDEMRMDVCSDFRRRRGKLVEQIQLYDIK